MKRLLLSFILVLACSALFAQERQMIILAHRGGSHEFDENTIDAFKKAYDLGYRSFETDIRLSKDGELIILHDDSFKRTAGVDNSVENMVSSEISKIKTLKGNKIPTAEEAMKYFAGTETFYIEWEVKSSLKSYSQEMVEELVDKLVALIKKYKPSYAKYVVTSFDDRAVKYMVAKYPEEATMLIFGDGLDKHAIQRCKDIGVNIVAAMVDRTTRQNVRLAHKEGITVNLWPGHNTDDFVTSWMLGADIVCTDVPGTLMKWLDESGWKKRAKL